MPIADLLISHPVLTVIAAVFLIFILRSVRIANQYERAVVFRLGKFNRTSGPGLYIVWLFVEWQSKLDLRTVTAAVEQQEGITSDNVPIKVERVQMKNVEIPPTMQRAMAQEAEALREKRARLIKAEAELDAAEQLRKAAQVIMQNPAALELRRMQMITEVGAEQNTMTIVMMPSEFVAMARSIGEMTGKTGG